MKIGQVQTGGGVSAAIFEDGLARTIPGHTLLDLLVRSEAEDKPLATLARELAGGKAEPLTPALPIHPPEVWGCGCTYETSASSRDAEHGTREGMCAHVYHAPRPEVFFKGTARVCVGPGEAIGIRCDSQFTAPEPELAVVIGPGN